MNGPDVDTDGSGAKVVLVLEEAGGAGAELVAPFVVDVVVDVSAFGVVLPQAATTNAATATIASCNRRARTWRMPASIAVADGESALFAGDYGSQPW